MNKEYKIVLLGDGGVGKTSLIRRKKTGYFDEGTYEPTFGAEVHTIDFESSCGTIKFHCWDTSGQEKVGELRDGYYDGADGAIIMFDLTSRTTYTSKDEWIHDLFRVSGDLPIAIVGNKADLVSEIKIKKVGKKIPTTSLKTYCEVSTKEGRNIDAPFLWLARRCVGDDELNFS